MTDFAATTDEMIRRIGAIGDEVGASVCFGTPVERDGHTLIPVARVSFGYGMGFGGGSGGESMPSEFGAAHGDHGEGGGGGGGGGGSSTPVAVIDVARDEVVVKPITDTTRIALSSYALAAWLSFWIMLTIRTIARERAKTRRDELKRAGA
jgi:uncharacterized spore protein YtfJ